MMGDLSENFSRREVACQCGCGADTVDFRTLEIVQSIRTWLNQPITINSAFRCPKWNEAVGGSPKSQHLQGRAIDFTFKHSIVDQHHLYGGPIDLEWLYGWMHERYGAIVSLGLYDHFIHVDTRTDGGGARWDMRSPSS